MVMNMTTDEAISILNSINDLFGAEYENTNPMIALNMAIAALERESSYKISIHNLTEALMEKKEHDNG